MIGVSIHTLKRLHILYNMGSNNGRGGDFFHPKFTLKTGYEGGVHLPFLIQGTQVQNRAYAPNLTLSGFGTNIMINVSVTLPVPIKKLFTNINTTRTANNTFYFFS